ncbi:MAG: LamG domain-containing protein [bacterium]|nr:LamG domain-containing protein [bacterium]
METKIYPAKAAAVIILATVLCTAARSTFGAPYESTLTINANKVAGDLSDFVVYVDLTDMSNDFWDNLTTGPGTTDIVVKNSVGTVLSREIVSIDTSTKTGEMHFKADSISGSLDTTFSISSGGTVLTNNQDTNTWSNGYAGIWHLGESSGNHNNSTGGKIGARKNNTHEANGKLGGAQNFDGNGDYIYIGSLNTDGDDLMTISAWVNLANLPSGGNHATVWGNYVNSNDRSLLNISSDDDKLTAFAKTGGNTIINDVKSAQAMSTDTWQYVTVSLNATAATAEVGLDGAFTSGDYLSAIQADNHAIGALNGAHYFDGPIDEFRISNVARSANWLLTEYNNQGSPETFYSVAPEPGTLAVLAAGSLITLTRRRRRLA